MADRYLLETSATDGYQLEDGSGVLLLEEQAASTPPAGQAALAMPAAPPSQRGIFAVGASFILAMGSVAATMVARVPTYAQRPAAEQAPALGFHNHHAGLRDVAQQQMPVGQGLLWAPRANIILLTGEQRNTLPLIGAAEPAALPPGAASAAMPKAAPAPQFTPQHRFTGLNPPVSMPPGEVRTALPVAAGPSVAIAGQATGQFAGRNALPAALPPGAAAWAKPLEPGQARAITAQSSGQFTGFNAFAPLPAGRPAWAWLPAPARSAAITAEVKGQFAGLYGTVAPPPPGAARWVLAPSAPRSAAITAAVAGQFPGRNTLPAALPAGAAIWARPFALPPPQAWVYLGAILPMRAGAVVLPVVHGQRGQPMAAGIGRGANVSSSARPRNTNTLKRT